MILTAHQPTFMPWLGTFHKILLADTFCFFDIAQYQKREWDNRNNIYTKNGSLKINIPVKSSNHYSKTIGNIKIDNKQNWQKKQYKTIYLNYKKHPQFEQHNKFLEDIYLNKTWDRLFDFNIYFYKYILKLIKKDIKLVTASDYNFSGIKSDLVLDMCKKLGASTYIFGGEGKNYANIKSFENNNIKLIFQEYNHPIYKQFHNKDEFVSHLSILDLIMNYKEKYLKNIIMQNNIRKV